MLDTLLSDTKVTKWTVKYFLVKKTLVYSQIVLSPLYLVTKLIYSTC